MQHKYLIIYAYICNRKFTLFFTPSQPGQLYQGVREKEGEYQSLIIPMVSVAVEHYDIEKERKKEPEGYEIHRDFNMKTACYSFDVF